MTLSLDDTASTPAKNAWLAGIVAREKGRPNINPFKINDGDEYVGWENGWMLADSILKE